MDRPPSVPKSLEELQAESAAYVKRWEQEKENRLSEITSLCKQLIGDEPSKVGGVYLIGNELCKLARTDNDSGTHAMKELDNVVIRLEQQYNGWPHSPSPDVFVWHEAIACMVDISSVYSLSEEKWNQTNQAISFFANLDSYPGHISDYGKNSAKGWGQLMVEAGREDVAEKMRQMIQDRAPKKSAAPVSPKNGSNLDLR